MIVNKYENSNKLIINDSVELNFYSYQEVLDFNSELVSYHIVIRISPTVDFLVELYQLFHGDKNFIKSIKIYDGTNTLLRDLTKDFVLDEAFVETFSDFEQDELTQGNLKFSYKIVLEENEE